MRTSPGRPTVAMAPTRDTRIEKRNKGLVAGTACVTPPLTYRSRCGCPFQRVSLFASQMALRVLRFARLPVVAPASPRRRQRCSSGLGRQIEAYRHCQRQCHCRRRRRHHRRRHHHRRRRRRRPRRRALRRGAACPVATQLIRRQSLRASQCPLGLTCT